MGIPTPTVSVWHGNRFARNAEAIAIEHGQNNEISSNTFEGDHTAIRLWQNPSQDPNWGYPKTRDTRSRLYRIEQNRFRNTGVALELRDTTGVQLWSNRFQDVGEHTRRQGDTSGFVELDGPPGVVGRPTVSTTSRAGSSKTGFRATASRSSPRVPSICRRGTTRCR